MFPGKERKYIFWSNKKIFEKRGQFLCCCLNKLSCNRSKTCCCIQYILSALMIFFLYWHQPVFQFIHFFYYQVRILSHFRQNVYYYILHSFKVTGFSVSLRLLFSTSATLNLTIKFTCKHCTFFIIFSPW